MTSYAASSSASSASSSSSQPRTPTETTSTTPAGYGSGSEAGEKDNHAADALQEALANVSDEATSDYATYLPDVPNATGGLDLKPLDVDAGTPDAWIARDERMVRLTGKHPYNTEAPLADLWKAGFLTPQSLFYVRSHGATPRVDEAAAKSWKIKIHGLVENEVEWSIDDLKERFETVTLPITLVCAGNRRKEQNMVTKGLGFNWGAAGVSTGLFTGVYLADVLAYCRPVRPIGAFPYDRDVKGRARHVIFEGADELPKGKYGTSQRLQWATDRSKGMLLAWGLNGEPLSPDHGFPIRLVVPGQIGGRMVKWLNRIEVSDRESQHYLHFWDNKLLPTQVTADQARAESHWWYDPKYIINDLNVNAAITVPDHNQQLDLSKEGEEGGFTRVAGYAYTGGGKRIHRAEITLDEGKSWQLAQLDWPEDLYRIRPIRGHPYYGTLDLTETEMSFSWCFWKLDVPNEDLRKAKSIAVRATDEALAQMPRDMYWNAMSMMNNWWFRVAIHAQEDGACTFEHPTLAGNANGGWMQRLNEEGKSSRYPAFNEEEGKAESAQTSTVKKASKEDIDALMRDPSKLDTTISAAQLQEHANADQPWFVLDGHVFDATAFLDKHPGGAESITLVAGEDATEDFMAIHSIDAKKMMREYHIGQLDKDAKLVEQDDAAEEKDPTKPFLHPKKWKKSMLVEKIPMSHDSFLFRFALAHPEQRVGLPIGQHVYVRIRSPSPDNEEEIETIQRAYTPFTGEETVGHLDILIKLYLPNKTWPNGGKMTSALHKLEVGQAEVELKGPLGHFIYEPGSQMRIHGHVRTVRRVAMIAGGSGITPIWSTLKGLMEDPKAQETEVWVLIANRTQEDILARTHIDDLIAHAGDRVHLHHFLSNEPAESGWKQGRGRLTLDCLRAHLPPAPPKDQGEDTVVLMCGPPAMEEAVSKSLETLGWDVQHNVVRF